MAKPAGSFMAPALHFVFPTKDQTDKAFPFINQTLNKLPYKVKEKHPPKEYVCPVKIYEKGNAGVGLALDFLTEGMIGSLNLHFYFVVEQVEDTRIVVAFHGNDGLQNSWLKGQWKTFVNTVKTAFPDLEAEWDTSIGLPKEHVSSPPGFRKWLRTGKWFLFT